MPAHSLSKSQLMVLLVAAWLGVAFQAHGQSSQSNDPSGGRYGNHKSLAPRSIPGVPQTKPNAKKTASQPGSQTLALKPSPASAGGSTGAARILWVHRGSDSVSDPKVESPAQPSSTAEVPVSKEAAGGEDYAPHAPQTLRVLSPQEAALLVQKISPKDATDPHTNK